MKIADVYARAARLQQARGFKIVATIVVVALALVALSAYILRVTGPDAPGRPAAVAQAQTPDRDTDDPGAARPSGGASEQFQRSLEAVLAAQRSPVEVAYAIGAVTAVAVVVIWLGLGLTYLALLILASAVATPMMQFEATEVYGRLLVGVVVLTASFTALMQALRVLLSAPTPVFAVARNVLAEAVRMKISMVFIVLLVFGLAALPAILDPETPLRYRVQSFLQYGAGGSFWLIALLVLFFSAASLTSEQRDKVIWQTITKPVAAWQYLLGKWLGVSLLSAALLLVCASGVFLFTEYLRSQPALGERVAYQVSAEGQRIAADRLILETQVLAARRTAEPTPPFQRDNPDFIRAARDRIDRERELDPEYARTRAEEESIIDDLYRSLIIETRAVAPGQTATYIFEGLGELRNSDRLALFRYKIDSGSNAPDVTYDVAFSFNGSNPVAQRVSLGNYQTIELLPTVVGPEGRVAVTVTNGAFVRSPDGLLGVYANPRSISFPEGGLEISYSAGSYQANFFRAVVVLWLKLAFLAALAIWASTFLSFPVACLVAVSAFLAAESASFLATALDRFGTTDFQGNFELWKAIIYFVGSPVAWIFRVYAELRPVTNIVDGQLITVAAVARGSAVLAAWSLLLFAASVLIFRKRELAMYSGQ